MHTAQIVNLKIIPAKLGQHALYNQTTQHHGQLYSRMHSTVINQLFL